MKSLSVLGTAAMFIVGGSILAHGIPAVSHQIELWGEQASAAWAAPGVLGVLAPTLLESVVGVVCGGVALAVVTAGKNVFGRGEAAH